jgi:hypothetical protein
VELPPLSETAQRRAADAADRGASRPEGLALRRIDASREEWVTVTRFSTVRVAGNVYSVPSRLIGYRLRARSFTIDLEYWEHTIETMERLRGNNHCLIDYRNLIHSLLRKPGALERQRYREALFPTVVFRKAYDRLVQSSKETGRIWSTCELVFGRYHA